MNKEFCIRIMPISCSECGASFKRIEVRENRDKPVGYAAGKPVYAKMYICKDCTNTWTEGETPKKEE